MEPEERSQQPFADRRADRKEKPPGTDCPAAGSVMNAVRWILRLGNLLLNVVVTVVLLAAGLYSGYALWDNAQVYTAVDEMKESLQKWKPEAGEPADSADSLEALRTVNPDVCAWLTLDHTKIDYPVLQGNDNMKYLNMDVYGDFALSGSIFLDADCDRTFSGAYSLLYGHHMDNSRMFGDLDRYKKKSFFEANTTGTLILPDCTYKLEIFACLLVSASEKMIFDPGQWQDGIDGLLDFAEKEAIYLHPETAERLRDSGINGETGKTELLRGGKIPQILTMSTCASEFTNARTVVLAAMEPYSEKESLDDRSQ